MKNPKEIERGLECCCDLSGLMCPFCPYAEDGHTSDTCREEMASDALSLIQQLERERDAMIEELKNAYGCFACKKFHRNGGECNGGGVCMMRDFEWRGVQKEE